MKQILVMMVAVVLVGQFVVADEKPIADPIVEKAVRKSLEKPEGELTKADLEKVTRLSLSRTKITDAGLVELAKLRQLKTLYLNSTKVTEAGGAVLKKALPNCRIEVVSPEL